MGEPAERIDSEESFECLIDHLGKLLAEEYISLMKRKEEPDESSDLRQVLERESKAGEY